MLRDLAFAGMKATTYLVAFYLVCSFVNFEFNEPEWFIWRKMFVVITLILYIWEKYIAPLYRKPL